MAGLALPSRSPAYSRLHNQDHSDTEDTVNKVKGNTKEPGSERSERQSTDHGADDGDDPPQDNDLEIKIRFGEGQDLSLRIPRTDSIATLKEKIKEARPSIGDKYLRLIHSGKILADDKTLIQVLPKSLFTQVEVPKTTESALTRIVTTVEAAANSTLTGITSRASEEHNPFLSPRTAQVQTSRGSVLPMHHVSHHHGHTTSDPLSTTGDHISITMPSDHPAIANNNTNDMDSALSEEKKKNRRSTVMIPVQTGPIYFLCSLSDHPPARPSRPSASKKGKAVVRHGANVSRSHQDQAASSSNNTSSSTAASSSLALPRRTSGMTTVQGSGVGSLNDQREDEEDDGSESDDDTSRNGELSPIMVPQATGFDRLREAGFSEEEIRSIRSQFHASRGTTTVGENGIVDELDQDEDATARARRIEEEWIDQHGAETLPDGCIVAGLMINVGFGVLHLYY
ncbi:hypothetical protein BGZ94_001431 [Podila epigama]|nr:hypothetical protein BGZ94_001431 [Podila epigama]